MISSRNLTDLPAPDRLEALCQSIAMLDAVLSPEWEYRYFSFNARWDEEFSERMASMRNGSGDHFFAVFGEDGAIIKGFDHEAQMSPWCRQPPAVWPGVLDHVPEKFARFLSEPAFSMDETTFCIWHEGQDGRWSRGPIDFPFGDDPDGSADLLWMFDAAPETYLKFARDYYERELTPEDVAAIYTHTPLSRAAMTRLNPEAEWTELVVEAEEIGYPIADRQGP
jgi:hypothetical protein